MPVGGHFGCVRYKYSDVGFSPFAAPTKITMRAAHSASTTQRIGTLGLQHKARDMGEGGRTGTCAIVQESRYKGEKVPGIYRCKTFGRVFPGRIPTNVECGHQRLSISMFTLSLFGPRISSASSGHHTHLWSQQMTRQIMKSFRGYLRRRTIASPFPLL